MRDAFLWINKNTEKNAYVFGDGINPYVIYYAERKITYNNISHLNSSKEAGYVVLHGFEHQTKELVNYINERTGKEFVPIQAFFFDAEKKQPAVIIYKANWSI